MNGYPSDSFSHSTPGREVHSKFQAKVFMLGGACGSTYEGAKKMPKTVTVTKPSPIIRHKSLDPAEERKPANSY